MLNLPPILHNRNLPLLLQLHIIVVVVVLVVVRCDPN